MIINTFDEAMMMDSSEIQDLKTCTKCGIAKPFSEFYKNKKNLDGLQSYCKTCCREHFKQYRVDNHKRIKERIKQWRVNNHEHIIEYEKQYRDANPEKAREWYIANREKVREQHKQYRESNHERIIKYGKQYYADNHERMNEYGKQWRDANPEKARELSKKWFSENPEKKKEHKRNRRARKRNAPGSHTASDIAQLLVLQKSKCAVCRCSIKNGYHVDHVVPLSKGGSNAKENLQLLCPTCNLSKGARDPVIFMQQRGFLL